MDKTLRFCIEPDDSIGTLETVLAIVRRLEIDLRALRTTNLPYGMEVQMRLQAPDEDRLTLCRMRLHNAVGVGQIREMPALAPPQPQQRQEQRPRQLAMA
ncbi:hypothetical protein ACLB1G_00065 [Oxalobacteraceae bacterium A2-2]